MKNLLFFALTGFLFLSSFMAPSNSTLEKEELIQLNLEGKVTGRYVIVYTMNGATHSVIVNKEVCCQCLVQAIEWANLDIVINDCGPLDGIVIPEGANTVSEEEALSDFGLNEWPE